MNGLKTGFGTFSWADGSMYKGDWVKDLFCGKGVYTWPNGRIYDGHWL